MLNSKTELFPPEIQHLIAFALEDAWQELKRDALAVSPSVKERLASTMVELAADGEADPLKLKRTALHVVRERRGAFVMSRK